MITIDEAIKHCEEVADINENIAENTDYDNWMNIASCEKCAEEHRQLAEWLKELKRALDWFSSELDRVASAEPERKKGKWKDYSDEGFVECPFCHSATNCDGNKDELNYCFSCGADLR